MSSHALSTVLQNHKLPSKCALPSPVVTIHASPGLPDTGKSAIVALVPFSVTLTPCAPVAPRSPVAPVAPVSPFGPVAPVAPVSPFGPVAPVSPRDPVAPVLPRGPMSPLSPFGPTGPIVVIVAGTQLLS